MVFHLNKYLLYVKYSSLCFRYLALSTLKLLFILFSILFLFEIVGPASNRNCEPTFANFGRVMLLSQACHISFHSIILLFEISILAHNLILDGPSSHSIYCSFFNNWVVDFLCDLKTLTDTSTIFENHIDVILHGIEITKVHIKVIEEV